MSSAFQTRLIRAMALLFISSSLAVGFFAARVWASTPSVSRERAEATWLRSGPRDYEISLLVQSLGETCYQRIVLKDDLPQTLLDTCETAWLQMLTVPRLFMVFDDVRQIEPSRCEASLGNCACHRVFTTTQFEYDQTLGYPKYLLTNSVMEPNWYHTDFWRQLLITRQIPTCNPSSRLLRIEVLRFTPLESSTASR